MRHEAQGRTAGRLALLRSAPTGARLCGDSGGLPSCPWCPLWLKPDQFNSMPTAPAARLAFASASSQDSARASATPMRRCPRDVGLAEQAQLRVRFGQRRVEAAEARSASTRPRPGSRRRGGAVKADVGNRQARGWRARAARTPTGPARSWSPCRCRAGAATPR